MTLNLIFGIMPRIMKRYLVIGGAGFIGSNFVDKLASRGDDVVIFDNFSRAGSRDNANWLKGKHKKIKVVEGDIRTDLKKLQDSVEAADIIHHLAAQTAVTISVLNPREDFEVNALGTHNILEAVRLSKNRPIVIYASTNKVYGGMEDVGWVKKGKRYAYKNLPQGVHEKHPLDFHSPYGCSKGTGDQYVRDYARIYGLKTVVMRQSCIYGPHQFGSEEQGWLAWFTIAAMHAKPITIYGDGMQVRDALHVDDLFEVWDLAAKNIEKAKGRVYNIGGGPAYTLSLLELITLLEKMLGKKISVSFSDWRPGDQKIFVANVAKAKRELGWKPKIHPEKGVKHMHAWLKTQKIKLK